MDRAVSGVRRILVVDDNEEIHGDFQRILCPTLRIDQELEKTADLLFERTASVTAPLTVHELEVATSGEQAVELMALALAEGKPFVMTFLDIRMPGGWNGLETAEHLWALQPDLQIVLCSAYSDYSWEEIRNTLPISDRYVILKKPFDVLEVRQLAESFSARHMLENSLRDGQRTLEEVERIAGLGHFVYDSRSGEWRNSSSLDEIFGVDATFVRDFDNWMSLISPSYREKLLSIIERSSSAAGTFEELCPVLRWKDGALRWMTTRGHWQHGPDGLPTRLLGSFQDITHSYLLNENLRLLEAAVSRINDAVIIARAVGSERDYPILLVNEAFTRITGYEPGEALGRHLLFLQGARTNPDDLMRVSESISCYKPIKLRVLNYRKSGEEFHSELDLCPIQSDNDGCSHWVAVLRDVTSEVLAQEKIERLAYFDTLTGLPNRRLLRDRFDQIVLRNARSRQLSALLFIDVDDFKVINDTYGHDTGDDYLLEIARRLRDVVREEDSVGRFGGDEFVILCSNLGLTAAIAQQALEAICEKLISAMSMGFLLAADEQPMAASVGAVLFADDADFDEVLKHADIAMYHAKNRGKGTFSVFGQPMQRLVAERARRTADLRNSIGTNAFELHYQPLVDRTGQILGAEALIRWITPEGKSIPPSEFIPLAEQTGLIRELGKWVIETACKKLAAWSCKTQTKALSLSVNVSPRQFQMGDFVRGLVEATDRAGVDPRRLTLEITENCVASDLDALSARMLALRSFGFKLSLDDFGTGYSSLAYLRNLPLDQLKIDRSFVNDILIDVHDYNISKTVVELGRTLGLAVVAEGVESASQYDVLRTLGCNGFQGYYFGRPMPEHEFDAIIEALK